MTTHDFSKVSLITVDTEHEGRRLDNYLGWLLGNVPKSRIYRIIRKGEVRVNKGRIRPNHRLNTGDVVRIPPIRLETPKDTLKQDERTIEKFQQAVIYEDEHLLVINKPFGMPVHAGSNYKYGLIERLRQARSDTDDYLELVHRLDRETSGCLIVARRPKVLRDLNVMLKEKDMQKTYQALVCGQWTYGEILIDQPLKRDIIRSGERMVEVRDDGKKSETLFKPLIVNKKASLIEVSPLTGRTHQIRVHAAWRGHPLVGDRKYGDESCNRRFRDLGVKRLCLHAAALSFLHPVTGIQLTVESSLPEDIRLFSEQLKA